MKKVHKVIGEHAVIVGAGMSGLAAAGALADSFERVTVLERDELPPGASPRAGTPQDVHLHVLVLGGQQALAELFPGFVDDLIAAGARPMTINRDLREEFFEFQPCYPQRDLGIVLYAMSRPVLESVVRGRVRGIANVVLRDRCRVSAVVAGHEGAAAGVRLEGRDGGEETLTADLVIDATRNGALTLSFLEAVGRSQPEESEIGIDMTYAATAFAIPDGWQSPGWKGVVTLPQMPESFLTGYLIPIEGNRWITLISDRHCEMPSADFQEFMRRAQQLRTSTIYDAIKDAQQLGGINRYFIPSNLWRHFERLGNFPRGLLPIGDAICRFNPVYGQGMTVAAKEACVLRDLIRDRSGAKDPLAGLGLAFLSAVEPLIESAWSQATLPDLVHPLTRGERPENLEEALRFGMGVMRLGAEDPDVHKTMMKVRQLAESPKVFQREGFVKRVQAAMAEG